MEQWQKGELNLIETELQTCIYMDLSFPVMIKFLCLCMEMHVKWNLKPDSAVIRNQDTGVYHVYKDMNNQVSVYACKHHTEYDQNQDKACNQTTQVQSI